MRAISARALAEVADVWSSYDVIGIDEGQFFPDVSTLQSFKFKQGSKEATMRRPKNLNSQLIHHLPNSHSSFELLWFFNLFGDQDVYDDECRWLSSLRLLPMRARW